MISACTSYSMDAFLGLFDPHRLLFTVPIFFSICLGSLSVIGLLDLEALDLDLDVDTDADLDADLDADVDADAETGGGGLFSLLGLGMIPFSLLLIILCFSFGWFGLLFESLFGDLLATWLVGPGWGQSLLFSLPAFAAGLLVTVPTARLLHPFFKDHGEARSARSLVGKQATLQTGSVSSTFGKAIVNASGESFNISVRTQNDENDLGRGDSVLIFDYDAESSIYYVSPLSEDDVLHESA